MWIAIVGIGIITLVGLYACCVVAGDADATAEWNRNWVGQKFDKERKDETD